MKYEVDSFRDGSVVLSCGEGGMEVDLVFAAGAMHGDPLLEQQTRILNSIADRMNSDPSLFEEVENLPVLL